MTNDPVMYGELSSWWPLISPPADYAEEVAYYAMLLREHGVIPVQRVLELGSGGGSNAFHLVGDLHRGVQLQRHRGVSGINGISGMPIRGDADNRAGG